MPAHAEQYLGLLYGCWKGEAPCFGRSGTEKLYSRSSHPDPLHVVNLTLLKHQITKKAMDNLL